MTKLKKNQSQSELLGFDLKLLQQDLTKTVLLSLFLLALLSAIAWWQR